MALKSYKELLVYQKGCNHFFYVAYGSCGELETFLSLSQDLRLLDSEKYSRLYALQEEVSKLLNGLIKLLSQKE
jgi:four helix bundle protein